MTDSAIQEDVQTTTGEDNAETTTSSSATPREPSAREQAVEAIAAGRRAELEQEAGVTIEDPDADPGEAQAQAARAQLERQAADPNADPDAQLAAQLQPGAGEPPILSQKVRVKIDGQEAEVAVADMVREYQKGRTADKRLEEAAAQRRALEEQQRQLAQQQSQRQQTNTDPVELPAEVTKKFTSALFEGDEEAASTAFAEAVDRAVQVKLEQSGRTNATPVDPQTIAEQVRQQLVFDSVLERSRQDYPQLYADPDIEALAATKIQRAMGEGQSFADALGSVSSEFATKFGWQQAGRSQPQARSTAARDAKLERKARTDTVTGLGIKSSTQETPPQSPSQVIADMARARGQSL